MAAILADVGRLGRLTILRCFHGDSGGDERRRERSVEPGVAVPEQPQPLPAAAAAIAELRDVIGGAVPVVSERHLSLGRSAAGGSAAVGADEVSPPPPPRQLHGGRGGPPLPVCHQVHGRRRRRPR